MLLLLTALSLSVAPQVPETASFTLAQTFAAEHDRVYLGQVATCSGSTRLCEEAYGIELGAAPAPGKSVFFPVDKIRSLLAKEWPGVTLRFDSTKPIKVTANAQVVDERAVLMSLRDRVAVGLAVDEIFQAQVEKVQIPSGLVARPGDYRIVFPQLTDASMKAPDWVRRHLGGNQRLQAALVHADAGDGEPPVLIFSVTTHVILNERLPVATRSMVRGESIHPEDFEDRWVEQNATTSRAITDDRGLIGRRLTRPIAAFETFPRGSVEIPDVVRRGQIVKLEMRGRGVNVTGRVEVLESGGYGEVISAIYPTTKKKLRVRVIDGDTVDYMF